MNTVVTNDARFTSIHRKASVGTIVRIIKAEELRPKNHGNNHAESLLTAALMKLDEDDVLSVPPGIAEQMPVRFKKVGAEEIAFVLNPLRQ
jgi:hypothetical protein